LLPRVSFSGTSIYLSGVALLRRDGLKFLSMGKMSEWKDNRAANSVKRFLGYAFLGHI
jgi:hypothetical protein